MFVTESLKLKITGIWCQVKEIRRWCKILYPGMDVGTPLSVALERGETGKNLARRQINSSNRHVQVLGRVSGVLILDIKDQI